jgi:hypothetical protein
MSVERMRWIWWQWVHGLRICTQRYHSACYDDSDDAFRQHTYYTGERADQLAGCAAYQHSAGYTTGRATDYSASDARDQKCQTRCGV